MTSESAPRLVPCPGCRRQAVFGPGNRWRPFCSERCRNEDLSAWASERFRVADTVPSDDDPAVPED